MTTILTPWIAVQHGKVITCYHTTFFLPFMEVHTLLHKRTRQSIKSSAYSVGHISAPRHRVEGRKQRVETYRGRFFRTGFRCSDRRQ